MTPARLLLAWSILRLRHPLIASQIIMTKPLPPQQSSSTAAKPTLAELDEHYRSASFVLDPPRSPAHALTESVKSLTLAVDKKKYPRVKSEDLVWDFNNGPRSLSSDELMALRVYRADTTASSSSSSSPSDKKTHAISNTNDRGEKREQYILFLTQVHCVLDGISTFVLGNEFFTLIGGEAASSSIPTTASTSSSSSGKKKDIVPRTEAQLHALLRAEWALRYGAASPLRRNADADNAAAGPSTSPSSKRGYGFMPPSLESRIPPFADPKLAIEDFERDQAQFQVCFIFFSLGFASLIQLCAWTFIHIYAPFPLLETVPFLCRLLRFLCCFDFSLRSLTLTR